jgi:DNA-binding MarR family transcriptional regulator
MDNMTDTLLGLFTEIAVLEHLVRSREERFAEDDLTMGDFGVLNYFMVNHTFPDSVAGIAWCFQEEEPYTRAKIEGLAGRDLVTIDPPEADNNIALVMITDLGREAHALIVDRVAPTIKMAVAEIPREELDITFKTLRNIRLTLDNLPDR